MMGSTMDAKGIVSRDTRRQLSYVSANNAFSGGLLQLDAEVVVWLSSPYKGTAESQNATEKHI